MFGRYNRLVHMFKTSPRATYCGQSFLREVQLYQTMHVQGFTLLQITFKSCYRF